MMPHGNIGLFVTVYVNDTLWDNLVILRDEIKSDDEVKQVFSDDLHTSLTDISGNHMLQQQIALESGDNVDLVNQIRKIALEISNPVLELDHETKHAVDIPRKCYKRPLLLRMNGYLLSLFVKTLKHSKFYRECVIKHLESRTKIKNNLTSTVSNSFYSLEMLTPVQINLVSPYCDVIDCRWNEILEYMVLERQELDHAMSWFSTLGGAFSAMGEEFEHCAEIAGKISLHQMRIALRLGDPLTVARCKLYMALSQIQLGHLKVARRLIEFQYKLAQSFCVYDERLIRMCLGVWAKLKYMQQLRIAEKCQRRLKCKC